MHEALSLLLMRESRPLHYGLERFLGYLKLHYFLDIFLYAPNFGLEV